MSSASDDEPLATVAAEGTELAQAHLARWLDALLPPGPCLVWAGGTTLASVLATDRRRSILLVEPRGAELEKAGRRARAGVMVCDGGNIASHGRFDSAVILPGGADPALVLGPLVSGVLREAVLAIVVEPSQARAISALLEAAGRTTTSVCQHLRRSSTLGVDRAPAMAEHLHGSEHDEPFAVVVLSGADALSSVLVGRDAGPSRWWSDVAWVRQSIRDVDAELRSVDAVQISELQEHVGDLLEQLDTVRRRERDLRAHAGGLERRIADLEGSTSWRVSAPLRWLADRVNRR